MVKNVFYSVLVINHLFAVNECYPMHIDQESEKRLFDVELYKSVLDPKLCQNQLTYLTSDLGLLAKFLDAGIRFPKGILMGNTIDLGNFHQCLAINEDVEGMAISGKYCRIRVPLRQNLVLPNFIDRSLAKLLLSKLQLNMKRLRQSESLNHQIVAQKTSPAGNYMDNKSLSPLSNVSIELAVCIPRPCSTEQALNGLIFNFTNIGFEFSEVLCRLPDDRPWAAADYIAIAVFSIIGFLTVISTCYDLYQSTFLKKGRNEIRMAYTSFSVYTNTRRLLTFNSSPESLDCVDGIRVLAMIWVILGHSFYCMSKVNNPVETFQWSISPQAMMVTMAPLTVDTFFLLSGLLLVYTTVGKLGRMQLLKKLHLFYLHRLLRIFPLLAAVILYTASFYMRVTDGPLWDRVVTHVFRCRRYWWSALLHVQNIVNPRERCIGVSWYLAIDTQLYILSPIVLFWVLTSKRAAWTALNTALIATLTASTVYIFFENFPSGIISPNRGGEMVYFFVFYYENTLPRASPFLIGMIYGYLLHLWRKKNLEVPKVLTTILLLCSLLIMIVVMYCSYIAMRPNWNNQVADNFFNSFLRSLWALALGWIIFACVQGRAELINCFLSHRIWKLPARLCYAMYLIHYSIMVVFYATISEPIHFTVPSITFNFMGFTFSTIILSFFATLLIESPFSTIFKILFERFEISGTFETKSENDLENEIYRKANYKHYTNEDVTIFTLSSNIPDNDLNLNITLEDNILSAKKEIKNTEN